MSIKNKFTIRPRLFEGESVTSYLVRVAHANQISFSELWKIVKKGDKYSVNRYYANKFDLYPNDLIDIKLLSKLLNMPNKILESHTFEPFISLFYPGASGRMSFSTDINLKHRKYCKSCLRETGVFKLIWQVKEITICDIHLTRLESICGKCGCVQPYLPEYSGYFKCCCGELLFNGLEKKEQEGDLLSKQLRIYRDWNYLISLQTHKNIKPNIQKIKRKIAITLLYLTFSGGNSIASRKNKYLTRNQVKKMVKIAKNDLNNSVVLNGLLKPMRVLNLEITELRGISVPFSYIKFILGKKKVENSKPRCKTPWCQSFGRRSSMRNLRRISNGRYIPKINLFRQHHICTDCWIQIGIDKNKGEWTEVNLSIPLLMKILELVESGLSVNRISKKLKLEYYKIVKYLGYLYRFNMIQNNNTMKKDIKSNEILGANLVSYFLELKPFWKNYQTLFRRASKIFGWSPLETFYYYWSPVIQQLLYLEMNMPTINVKNRIGLVEDVKNVLNNVEETNSEITVEEVAAAIEVNENVLYYHSLSDLVRDTNKRIRSIRKSNEEDHIVKKINEFVAEKKNKRRQIFKKDIYKYLGKSPSYINKNYPNLQSSIHDIAENSKLEQKVIREENIKEIIHDNIRSYGRLDLNVVSDMLGITEESLKNGYYRLINQTLKEIEINKK
ncbi:TniQ family protein [Terrihalobacillus insolitus]|uniref:TniQ family protein n=1 Tax=Terrihalobacillus insolitus TaxID=2950438 RepID=UPI002340E72C|nr:TniQ family protein [Terrihalobacillus insolitus]MDC3414768.1 TniQ family protein [Terrihalobacillus insolitus]